MGWGDEIYLNYLRKQSRKTAPTIALPPPARVGKVTRIEVTLPIKVISEPNQREHWSVKADRNQEQQAAVLTEWQVIARHVTLEPPCVIKLTRIGNKPLDSDNLAGAFKFVRDSVARIIGIDDGSPLLTWAYDQETGSTDYSIRIEINCV